MDTLIRDSLFGRLSNSLISNKLWPYPNLEACKFETLSTSPTSTISVTPEPSQQFIVEFSGDDDPDMPRNWSLLSKTLVTLDIMLLNFSFYAASAIFTPSIPGIEEQFGATTAEGTLGLSLFVIAYGIGPLFVWYTTLIQDLLWLIIWLSLVVSIVKSSSYRPHTSVCAGISYLLPAKHRSRSWKERRDYPHTSILWWFLWKCPDKCWRSNSDGSIRAGWSAVCDCFICCKRGLWADFRTGMPLPSTIMYDYKVN